MGDLYNNNAEKLLSNCQKNCPINDQVTYRLLFLMNFLIFQNL